MNVTSAMIGAIMGGYDRADPSQAPDMIILAYAIGAIIILGYSAVVATRRLPEREDAALPGRPGRLSR
jgi:hypothetical protein